MLCLKAKEFNQGPVLEAKGQIKDLRCEAIVSILSIGFD